jgi:hypothetical protein
MGVLVTRYDAEDPGHFVDWYLRYRELQPRSEDELE